MQRDWWWIELARRSGAPPVEDLLISRLEEVVGQRSAVAIWTAIDSWGRRLWIGPRGIELRELEQKLFVSHRGLQFGSSDWERRWSQFTSGYTELAGLGILIDAGYPPRIGAGPGEPSPPFDFAFVTTREGRIVNLVGDVKSGGGRGVELLEARIRPLIGAWSRSGSCGPLTTRLGISAPWTQETVGDWLHSGLIGELREALREIEPAIGLELSFKCAPALRVTVVPDPIPPPGTSFTGSAGAVSFARSLGKTVGRHAREKATQLQPDDEAFVLLYVTPPGMPEGNYGPLDFGNALNLLEEQDPSSVEALDGLVVAVPTDSGMATTTWAALRCRARPEQAGVEWRRVNLDSVLGSPL